MPNAGSFDCGMEILIWEQSWVAREEQRLSTDASPQKSGDFSPFLYRLMITNLRQRMTAGCQEESAASSSFASSSFASEVLIKSSCRAPALKAMAFQPF